MKCIKLKELADEYDSIDGNACRDYNVAVTSLAVFADAKNLRKENISLIERYINSLDSIMRHNPVYQLERNKIS